VLESPSTPSIPCQIRIGESSLLQQLHILKRPAHYMGANQIMIDLMDSPKIRQITRLHHCGTWERKKKNAGILKITRRMPGMQITER
jgi:hypothetical protein